MLIKIKYKIRFGLNIQNYIYNMSQLNKIDSYSKNTFKKSGIYIYI